MSRESAFGAEPEQLRELLSFGLEDLCEPDVTPAASLGAVLERPGGQIGRYKLHSVLGEGGMGIVYLAEQQHPIKRRVALKVIKPGMDSKRVITRFEAERQALALLDHPNIAHVHDAGTTETGRPYFVMEYVKGLPITEHCDHYKLTIEDRLNLFLQVCHAVHHAHQKGIIHRDIKPSNILVSLQEDQALPKIIDFGVAKAIARPLTERTLTTEGSQLLGTPEYMSPEQADMASEDIDTRSDIYSLGVLLYVLLTGVLPFDSKILREGGVEHIRHVIRETDPRTPSTRLSSLGEEAKKVAQSRRTEIATLAKKLHKELEWIPLKAMRKERAERYRSASEFADDIENYLNGKPLIAGPPGTLYRLNKSVRRHKALVAGTLVVFVVFLIGTVVSMIFAIGQSRARAEAQSIADFLRTGVLGTVTDANVGEATVTYMLDAASKNLEGLFNDQPLVEASIRHTIGLTYRNLGESKVAEPHLERALQIRREHLGQEHPDTLDSVQHLAWLRLDQGRYTETAELLEKAMSACRNVLGDEHVRMLDFANTLGCVYYDLGRYDDAEQLYLKGIPIALRLLGEQHNTTLFMVGNLGATYYLQGRYKEAERKYLEMLRLREGFWDDENEWTLFYKGCLAQVYREQKRYEKAEQLYLEILPIQRRVDGSEHWCTLYSVRGLARVYTHLYKHDEAEKLFTEALQGLQRVRGPEHRDTVRCMNGLAELYTMQRQFDKAKELLTKALEISSRTLGNDHPWTLTSMSNLAVLYKEQTKHQDAEPLMLEALEGRRLKLGDQHPHTLESWNNLIELYEAWGKPEKAKEWQAKIQGGLIGELKN
jgi:non-specific serine/threonine protein kinase/serine/threonine-protein kinase